MLRSGLTSVTFRNKTPDEIIEIAVQAGLEAIEWGGDRHVRHGDWKTAEQVGEKTRGQGLLTPSYGSYYRCLEQELPFRTALDTVKALGCGAIRIWAGNRDGVTAGEEEFSQVANTLNRAIELAQKEGIAVACEFHGGTLNDSLAASEKLLSLVPGLKSYWQPLNGRSIAEETAILEMLGERLLNVHTYCGIGSSQRALKDGEIEWQEYIGTLRTICGGREAACYLEFVKGGETEQLLEDAEILKGWLK